MLLSRSPTSVALAVSAEFRLAKFLIEGCHWYFCTLCKKSKQKASVPGPITKKILLCKHELSDVCISKLTPGLSNQVFEYYRVKGWITGAEEGWKKKLHDIPCECGSVHILNFNFEIK